MIDSLTLDNPAVVPDPQTDILPQTRPETAEQPQTLKDKYAKMAEEYRGLTRKQMGGPGEWTDTDREQLMKLKPLAEDGFFYVDLTENDLRDKEMALKLREVADILDGTPEQKREELAKLRKKIWFSEGDEKATPDETARFLKLQAEEDAHNRRK